MTETLKQSMSRSLLKGLSSLAGSQRHSLIHFLSKNRDMAAGFHNRAAQNDLYYTVFGLALAKLTGAGQLTGGIDAWLAPFTARIDQLDLVELSCLARCWGYRTFTPGQAAALLSRMERFRSRDGGFNPEPGAPDGTLYGAFLALGAWQDLGQSPPDLDRLAASIEPLRLAGGGYTNQIDLPFPMTPATAAAIVLLHNAGRPIPSETVQWLWTCRRPGGFPAFDGLDEPDLLSTAVALHALHTAGFALPAGFAAECRAFVAGCLLPDGGFCAGRDERQGDLEYTWYGLLALGELTP